MLDAGSSITYSGDEMKMERFDHLSDMENLTSDRTSELLSAKMISKPILQ